jgi:CelD/BcsL family acetyltransferase involved in cellulose biosynthesis
MMHEQSFDHMRYMPGATLAYRAEMEVPAGRSGLGSHMHREGIETITSHDRLVSLAPEWNRLAENIANPLMTHDWAVACSRAFSTDESLHIIVRWKNGSVGAIAPLVCRGMRQFGRLEVLGGAHLMEPTFILFDDADSATEVISAAMSKRLPLSLTRVLPHDALHSAIHAAAEAHSFLVIRNTSSSPWIALLPTWEAFEHRLTSQRRSTMRRRKRRLASQGTLEVKVLSGQSHELHDALTEAYRIEGSGWKKKNGTSILSNSLLLDFFTRYCGFAARSGIIRLFLLTLNGKGIAMILAVEYARRLWTLKVGYDEAWARFSPGILLHDESIKWAVENKLEGFEFLGRTEPWTAHWDAQFHSYTTYRLAPKSARGFAWLGMETARVVTDRLSRLWTLCVASFPTVCWEDSLSFLS